MFFCVHFLPASAMKLVDKCKHLIDSQMQAFAEPKKRRTGGEVSFAKKQTSRIFAPFNILPLVDPPLAVEIVKNYLMQ